MELLVELTIIIFIILIIVVPVYFLSKFFLKKANIGNEKNRKYLAIIPTVIVSPIVYSLLGISLVFYLTYYPKEPFHQQKLETNIEKRYTMSDDMIKSKMLIGKTEEEVLELLGKDYLDYDEKCITYYLGFAPGIANIDPDILEIYFENGKVVEVIQRST